MINEVFIYLAISFLPQTWMLKQKFVFLQFGILKSRIISRIGLSEGCAEGSVPGLSP